MQNMKEKIVIIDGCRTPFLKSETDFLNTMTYELGQLSIKGLINKTGIDAIQFSKKMEESGAGELLITSMDRDGTQVGYDIELMSKISSNVNIPVIASGGVGNLDHLVDGIKLGNASAVLAASIFHYGKYSVKEAKEYLDSKGIPVRI